MLKYQIRKLHKSEKQIIEFRSRPEDEGLRKSLTSIFEPLGYESSFDGNYLYIHSGPANPHGGKITISSDEFGTVWCDCDTWGNEGSNQKWIDHVDSLLQASGLFVKI
jgi:hypothetical protein